VNIDNGFGAAYVASMIARRAEKGIKLDLSYSSDSEGVASLVTTSPASSGVKGD
jgi:hypothetical protein